MSSDHAAALSSRPAPATTAERAPVAIPDHAIAVPGGEWQLWRDFVLRGTGFPALLVQSLNENATAAAADRLAASAEALQTCRYAAITAVRRALQTDDPGDRAEAWTRRRLITKGTPAIGVTAEEDAFARAVAAHTAAEAEYRATFAAEAEATHRRIVRIAAEPRFREATLWQNHQAVGYATRHLGAGKEADRRRAAELVAIHLQRYTVKNDSIGFFGPIGWGRLSDRAIAVELFPGPTLVDRREVDFEAWCIDTLVDRFNEDPAMRRWIPPRVSSGVWSDAVAVYAPQRGVVPLTARQRRVFDHCDGRTLVTDLARVLVSSTASGVASETALAAVIDELVALGVVVWRLEVPSQMRPERELGRRLAAIGDPALRQRCTRALAELVEARDRIERAAGKPEALDAALRALDATFERLTGQLAARRPGQTYGARGLVYEDCRRNCELVLGRRCLERLGPPLSLVLDGVRWAAGEVAAAMRQHMRARHAALRRAFGTEAIDADRFRAELLSGDASTERALDEVQQRVQAAWAYVLDADYRTARVTRSIADVGRRARDVFGQAVDIWGRIDYISPDVMIAAPSLEAFRRGDFHCVLGEVHNSNSLLWASLIGRHPNPDALAAAAADDAGPRLQVFAQRTKAEWLARCHLAVHPPTALQYQFGADVPNATTCRPAPAAMFVAVDDGERVVIRARDGSLAFDALELFGMILCHQTDKITGRFLPSAPHVPRVTIDGVTIARESWRIRVADMPFLTQPDRASQYAGLRAWAASHRMPPRVFYKSPYERKPCYLDVNSPIYAAIFMRFLKQLPPAAFVRVEEMFPDVTEAWLEDADGARYTCELRLAAFRQRDGEAHAS